MAVKHASKKKYNLIASSPIGALGCLYSNNNALRGIIFLGSSAHASPAHSDFDEYVLSALNQYFSDPTYTLNLPMVLEATDFQKRVLTTLQNIPYGETRTYGELASALQTSPRAIGNACRRNPLPLLIPCHRVVSQSGLGGFSGQTNGTMIEVKQYLLTREAHARRLHLSS